jgi:hypothetical protein
MLAAPGASRPVCAITSIKIERIEGTFSRRREKLLFAYDLDLFIKHFPGKPVDRDLHPVMLFSFHDEIVLEALCIWLVVTRLGYYIDQYVPDACL